MVGNWKMAVISALLLGVCGASLAAQAPMGVRGKIESLAGNKFVVYTSSGAVHVTMAKGVQAFARTAGSRDSIGPNSFVGITSVKAPDGMEVATEIHIFPKSLRGLGEGSHMMDSNGPGGKPNRMTNGTVKQLANLKPSRMTNGAVKQQSKGSLTLAYKDGKRSIEIPPNVAVTMISPMPPSQLKIGMNVFALGRKQKDGSWLVDRVMLASPPAAHK